MRLTMSQKQRTRFIMTTELRQAINLLQYNTIDLIQFIHEQAMENPLIELIDPDIEEPFQTNPTDSNQALSDTPINIDNIPQTQNTILDYILVQIDDLMIEKEKRSILKYITLNLDNGGFLSIDVTEIAEQLGIDVAKAELCLSLLQDLEPIGIGARNIHECLLLQARHYFPDSQLIHDVIENHLEDISTKNWENIAKSLSVTLENVKQVVDTIVTLNPKPCVTLFEPEAEAEHLFPDLIIYESYGTYKISLSDTYLPDISIRQDYMNLQYTQPHLSSYIQSNYRNYLWLKNSIEKRASTIQKIGETIIAMQPSFLSKGLTHLKPMTMTNIAEAINMHESTVSRATRNKVIQTPAGTFEMNTLFSSKLKKNDVGDASSVQVKHLMKLAIQQESPNKPLSDQQLADKFKLNNGIIVSRRTIAKYREELNILPSNKRKKLLN